MNTGIYNYEISEALDGKVNIMTYDELEELNTIDDVLGPHDKAVILYSTSESYGHWVCLWKHENTINFFDSYGYFPDDERKFIPEAYLKLKYNKIPHLTALLYKCKYPIRYNEYKLQNETTHTCGRWCIVRLLLDNLNEHDFYNVFKQFKHKDRAIYNLTRA